MENLHGFFFSNNGLSLSLRLDGEDVPPGQGNLFSLGTEFMHTKLDSFDLRTHLPHAMLPFPFVLVRIVQML